MCRRKASKTPQFFSSGEGGMRPMKRCFFKHNAFQMKSIANGHVVTCLGEFKKFSTSDLVGEKRLLSMHQASCEEAVAKLSEAQKAFSLAEKNVAAMASKLQKATDALTEFVPEESLVNSNQLSDIAKKNTTNSEPNK